MGGDYRLGLLLVTGSAVAWSTAGLFTRLIALDAATMLVWRGLFGALGMFAFILVRERRAALAAIAAIGRAGFMFALVSAVAMICFIAALSLTTVTHVAVIYATAPFIAAGLGWLALGERPGGGSLAASLAAFAGVLVMVATGERQGSLAGDLLALAMTAGMACLMVLARARPGIPTVPAACLSALLSASACLPFATSVAVTDAQLVWLALFGLTNSALGLILFMLGSRHLPPVETALVGALDAPLAPVWVWLAFAETPSLNAVAGGLVVMAAVVAHILASGAAGRGRA